MRKGSGMEENSPRMIEPIPEGMIRAIVHHTFGEDARMTACEPLEGGLFNTSYHVEVADPNLDTVLRIAPPDASRMLAYERTMMAAEPRIYAMMRDAGVAVPRVLACDVSRTIIPRDFIFVEFIAAPHMGDPSIPQKARPALARELGENLVKIHSIRGDCFGWPMEDGSIRGNARWSEVIAFMLNEVALGCVTHGVISKAEIARIEGAFGKHRGIFDAITEPRLTHNDIWDPNILVRENGRWHMAALIDADRAMFADREFESTLWWNREPAFWEGYGVQLDPSPEAALRRKFYELYVNLWQAFAFKVQIWNPDWCESFRQGAMRVLGEIEG